MKKILVATTDHQIAVLFKNSLPADYQFESCQTLDDVLKITDRQHTDFVFIDLHLLPAKTTQEAFLETLMPFFKHNKTVVLVPREMMQSAVKIIQAGASDYLTCPFDPVEIRIVLQNLEKNVLQQSELNYLRNSFWKQDSLDIIQTHNPIMQEVFEKVRAVAPTKATVILYGETGTGKTMVAKLIHRHSNRSSAQFISVHCGAIPDTLLESELFGHEKGAFTGAVRKKLGKFEVASEGSIFLDEIGSITPSAQIKMLQVLQDGTFSRVGSELNLQTNARVIAATNADLKQMTTDGSFRRDLYYRLNVLPIELPPLRERTEDIPLLVNLFLEKLNKTVCKDIHTVHPLVAEAFQRYEWPGNIRELENLMERAYILETSQTLMPERFPPEIFPAKSSGGLVSMDASLPIAESRRLVIENFERRYLMTLFARNQGKISQSATQAGITTRQLNKLMQKYGIRKEQFKKPVS
jgi:DNA-binding NtrC family response regulator